MKIMDNGLNVPKWVLIVLLRITPNAPEFICPTCLPKPKSSGFHSASSPCFELAKQTGLVLAVLKISTILQKYATFKDVFFMFDQS